MNDSIHISGGNRFDKMRIDLPAAYALQDGLLASVQRRSTRRSWVSNNFDLAFFVALRALRLHETLVNNAADRRWIEPFMDYWGNFLGGRPLTTMDFHSLRFHYRMLSQEVADVTWGDKQTHLKNWQTPENISYTFLLLYRQALHPIRNRRLWRYLKPGMRALEYGCALAPMYMTWRRFLNHVPMHWTLADIPNFPFHYLRHATARDTEAEHVVIDAANMDDPLRGKKDLYDIIFIQEVFEHLHNPLLIAEYLLGRLKAGGLLFFDYIESEASGLDTPAGLALRRETLALLADRLEIIEGDFKVNAGSLGLCIGRRR